MLRILFSALFLGFTAIMAYGMTLVPCPVANKIKRR